MDGPSWKLHLLAGPQVQRGDRLIAIPEGSKRLLVYLALCRRPVTRRHAASVLWPDGDEARAAGNLRSALWRLRGANLDLLSDTREFLALEPDVAVDLYDVDAWSSRLLYGTQHAEDLRIMSGCRPALDLLPGWYDDWVIVERERWRTRMLGTLEALADLLVHHGRTARAVEAALLAVSADPLRESAQYCLLRAHLAEGNDALARRAYARYARAVRDELGAEPSEELGRLLTRSATRRSQRRTPDSVEACAVSHAV